MAKGNSRSSKSNGGKSNSTRNTSNRPRPMAPKQSMLYAYNIEDYGEPPAYTVGAVASKLLRCIV